MMIAHGRSMVTAVCLILLAGARASSAEPHSPDQLAPRTSALLIEKLTEVAESDVGYSPSVTGTAFLPLDRAGEAQTMLLFQPPSVPSETLRELVKHGAAALPLLLAHLDDRRPTRITIGHDFGMGGLFINDGFDRLLGNLEERDDKRDPKPFHQTGFDLPTSYTVTVGDLCYVAIGQIVNRPYNAVRYQPTAIIIVTAPGREPNLCRALRNEWGGLTREKHRDSLLRDLLQAHSEDRRNGAAKRLAYYYPDALEAPAVQLLRRPTYDVFAIETFVRRELYAAKDDKQAHALFDAFLDKHGEAAREGILQQLFGDLELLEANEGKRLYPPLKGFADQPRQLLILLYGRKKNVQSKDRPTRDRFLSASVQARLISEGLIYDRSDKLDQAVRALLVSIRDDDYLALACMKRLVGRGYDADLEAYCRRRLPRLAERDREELQRMRDRLGWTRLHVAVERDDADAVQDLLRHGTDVNARSRIGTTPLHLAAAAGALQIVRMLVASGAALDPKNGAGLTPAQLASANDRDEVVQFLVHKGCAVPDILVAALGGKVDRVAAWLRKDPESAAARTKHQRTPLHLAAAQGQTEAAELLLAGKAQVDAQDEEKYTPLQVAVLARHPAVVRVLLAHGADTRRTLGDGYQPLHLAALAGDPKAAELLLASGADLRATAGKEGRTALHLAAAQGQIGVARLLLDKGLPIDVRDNEGQTPLHLAATEGRKDVVELLLARKATIAAADRGHRSPLDDAVVKGRVEIVQTLLAHGADVNRGRRRGRPFLHQAVAAGNLPLAQVLLAAKAPVDARDPAEGETALHEAAAQGHVGLVKFLLDHGANVNARASGGWTPLHLAAREGRKEAAELLLARNADVDARDGDGFTPLHLASFTGQTELARLLLAHHADPGLKTRSGETARDIAVRRKHPAIAELLGRRKP